MIAALIVWSAVGAAIAIGARCSIADSWQRALAGFAWPTFPLLAAVSRVRYDLRRRHQARKAIDADRD